MKHFVAAIMIAGLALSAMSSAQAAPKTVKAAAEKTCALGRGKYVCCKAGVADHCLYVACCEKGNAAFFTQTECTTCEQHVMETAMHGSASSCATAASGNAAFFTASACSGSDAASCSDGSCSTAKMSKSTKSAAAKK